MTLQKAVELACALRPNELGEAVLTHFVEEREANLALEIRGEKRCEPCTPVTRDELAVPPPFDRVYWAYLVSLIDLAAGDAEAYAMSNGLFERARAAYAKWVQRTGGRT